MVSRRRPGGDPYRYGCPEHGHVSLRPNARGGYWCHSCKQLYERKRDKKTGALVA